MTVEKRALLNLISSEKYCHKSIGIGVGSIFQLQYWYWYRQYFMARVLLLVLTIVFMSIVNIPAYT